MELQNCVRIIRENSSKIVCDFGIRTLRIFGSVSRNEQTENSENHEGQVHRPERVNQGTEVNP